MSIHASLFFLSLFSITYGLECSDESLSSLTLCSEEKSLEFCVGCITEGLVSARDTPSCLSTSWSSCPLAFSCPCWGCEDPAMKLIECELEAQGCGSSQCQNPLCAQRDRNLGFCMAEETELNLTECSQCLLQSWNNSTSCRFIQQSHCQALTDQCSSLCSPCSIEVKEQTECRMQTAGCLGFECFGDGEIPSPPLPTLPPSSCDVAQAANAAHELTRCTEREGLESCRDCIAEGYDWGRSTGTCVSTAWTSCPLAYGCPCTGCEKEATTFIECDLGANACFDFSCQRCTSNSINLANCMETNELTTQDLVECSKCLLDSWPEEALCYLIEPQHCQALDEECAAICSPCQFEIEQQSECQLRAGGCPLLECGGSSPPPTSYPSSAPVASPEDCASEQATYLDCFCQKMTGAQVDSCTTCVEAADQDPFLCSFYIADTCSALVECEDCRDCASEYQEFFECNTTKQCGSFSCNDVVEPLTSAPSRSPRSFAISSCGDFQQELELSEELSPTERSRFDSILKEELEKIAPRYLSPSVDMLPASVFPSRYPSSGGNGTILVQLSYRLCFRGTDSALVETYPEQFVVFMEIQVQREEIEESLRGSGVPVIPGSLTGAQLVEQASNRDRRSSSEIAVIALTIGGILFLSMIASIWFFVYRPGRKNGSGSSPMTVDGDDEMIPPGSSPRHDPHLNRDLYLPGSINSSNLPYKVQGETIDQERSFAGSRNSDGSIAFSK